MKMTKVRAKCYRLVHNGRWGIVDFNGSEWLARVAFYQKRGSRGPIVKPKSKRMPRYRRVGFFPSRWKATDALCRVLDPRYAETEINKSLWVLALRSTRSGSYGKAGI
jgi:hypothetical protein